MANDFISHANLMKPQQKLWTARLFLIGEYLEMPREWGPRLHGEKERSRDPPRPCSMQLFTWLFLNGVLYNKTVIMSSIKLWKLREP